MVDIRLRLKKPLLSAGGPVRHSIFASGRVSNGDCFDGSAEFHGYGRYWGVLRVSGCASSSV